MKLESLIGAGDRIVGATVPFAAAGIVANILWPCIFHLGFGRSGLVAGVCLLAVGVPGWLWSAAQVATQAPKGRLITTGPFAVCLHPLYTSVALCVIPGCSLLADSWLGFAVGAVLYGWSRLFAPREERDLAARFGAEYQAYRKKVLLPWI